MADDPGLFRGSLIKTQHLVWSIFMGLFRDSLAPLAEFPNFPLELHGHLIDSHFLLINVSTEISMGHPDTILGFGTETFEISIDLSTESADVCLHLSGTPRQLCQKAQCNCAHQGKGKPSGGVFFHRLTKNKDGKKKGYRPTGCTCPMGDWLLSQTYF